MDLSSDVHLNDVRFHLKGVPDPLIVRHLVRAAQQVARETLAWNVEVYRAESPEDEYSVEPVLPSGFESRVWEISGAFVEIDGGDDAVAVRPKWDGERVLFPRHRTPIANTRRSRGRIVHRGKPAGVLVVTAVLEPGDVDFNGDAVTTVPDNPFLLLQKPMVAWALKELLQIPNSNWTDVAASARHERDYRHWVADAAVRIAQQGTTEPVHTATMEFI